LPKTLLCDFSQNFDQKTAKFAKDADFSDPPVLSADLRAPV
jgi:hypothetical protein